MKNHRRMTQDQRSNQIERFINVKQFTKFQEVAKFSEHYKLGKELGRGAFGVVKVGTHRKSGVPCAIKTVIKEKLDEYDVYKDLMKNELEVLEQTNHPHITRIFQLLEDKRNIYIVMELVSGGNLLDQVYQERRFTEAKAANVIDQLCRSLNFMHKKNITHRDLKPENLLCEATEDGRISIKLTDFGFATVF